jgi:putative transposase
MGTYTQILYQIVFGTKYHHKTLLKPGRVELYKYMAAIIRNKKCFVYLINGVENHVHILTHVHPTVALSDLVKDVKVATSGYIKETKLFPSFAGWQVGYGGFTYSRHAKENLIRYIENQEEHHRKKTYLEELTELLEEHGVPFDPKYLLE